MISSPACFASSVDYFQNVSGTVTNFSGFPTSSLKVVYSIYKCKPVLAHLDCETHPVKLRKYPVSENGHFVIDSLGMPGVIATRQNEILWRFQVEFPDGLISENFSDETYRDSDRRLGFSDNLILTRVNQLNVFRMPDMKITFKYPNGNLIPIEKLLKFQASYYTRTGFNPACMTEHQPNTACSKKITNNPFVIKGLAAHMSTPLDVFKNYMSFKEGVTIDDPSRPKNSGWVLYPYKNNLNFADYSFPASMLERDIILDDPNLL
jgi:hypothetical protein